MNHMIQWNKGFVQPTFQSLDKLSNKFGPSFYLFNRDLFIKNLNELKTNFENYYSNVTLGYSFKTNYIPAVCKAAYNNGVLAEVVSGLEYKLALKIGYTGSNIIFNGPLKEKHELYRAFNNNSLIHFDSYTEIEILKDYLKKNPDRRVQCALRCNFGIGEKSTSRFGFDVENGDAEKVYKELFALNGCSPIGIHCHFSTGHRSTESYEKRTFRLAQLAKRIFEGKDLHYVDIGGGFFGKMPQHIEELFAGNIPSFSDYGKAIGNIMHEQFPKHKVTLILEPGTAVVANTMAYVCQVYTIKQIKNKPVITLTGGKHNVRPTGTSANIPFRVIPSHKERRSLENALIGGYTCMENDVIDYAYDGSLSVGDYLIFDNMGAYNIVFKPPFIKEAPPILMLKGKEKRQTIDVIRRRETLDDIFSTFKF